MPRTFAEGSPREIGDDEIASTIRKTLETLPKGRRIRGLRTMAREIGHAFDRDAPKLNGLSIPTIRRSRLPHSCAKDGQAIIPLGAMVV